jgi:ribose/xylose/arabinose/galactoside ABC-type transport system permease subunit
VPVRGVIAFTYVVSGCLAGVVGVLFTSQFSSGSASFGAGYELAAITAVVIGGSSLSGGKGKIFGTLLGTLVIAVIQNGMNLLGVISYAQRIILGVIIVGAALVDRWRQSQDRRGN